MFSGADQTEESIPRVPVNLSTAHAQMALKEMRTVFVFLTVGTVQKKGDD